MTMPIGAIHCFCWPFLSVDVIGIYSCFLWEFFDLLCNLLFCDKAYVSTMSSQDKIKKGQRKSSFYCEKYTYHFLTIAICWCHPTHWPTLRNVLYYLKKPVSECGSRKPPNGHVTTPIGAIHCFCWPSLSVDVFWKYSFFVEVLWIYCGLCLF